MSVCRSCGAVIEWAVTDNGRKMPLDLGSFADGRLVVVGRRHELAEDGARRVDPLVVVLNGDQLARLRAGTGLELRLRRSHFQTCPDADSWRT